MSILSPEHVLPFPKQSKGCVCYPGHRPQSPAGVPSLPSLRGAAGQVLEGGSCPLPLVPCSTSAAPGVQQSFRGVSFYQSQTDGVWGCLRGSPCLAWAETNCPHRAEGKELASEERAWGWKRRKGRERKGAPAHKVKQYFKYPLFHISV